MEIKGLTGLSENEVEASRKMYGENRRFLKKENRFLQILKSLAGEPMVLLLLATSLLYWITGNYNDSIFLAIAILLVAAISIFQDYRSRSALDKLKELSQPFTKAVRNSSIHTISTAEVVMNDIILIEEGTLIPADAAILQSNDFTVNESILTGESFTVTKDNSENNQVYQGTTVASGTAFAKVTAIGGETKLGKIGKSLDEIDTSKTPLEEQIHSFILRMVIVGVIVFIAVWIINFIRFQDVTGSLLKALTLAMSILPEEIPVAFTTFMALGAWRLMKSGIIVKQMKTVETLGSATIICTDKTGTITENKMELAAVYSLAENSINSTLKSFSQHELQLIESAMWASEPVPFDPMEKALHSAYQRFCREDERHAFRMIHEYPLDGKPPLMTHLFEDQNGNRKISAKGAPEAFLKLCVLTGEEQDQITACIRELTSKGLRVLGVARSDELQRAFPESQEDYTFHFLGVVAFQDPPKHNIKSVLANFYKAGLKVKIITGDNTLTTKAIAQQIGFQGYESTIEGDALMQLSDEELKQKVNTFQIFTRMFPEAKLRVINALKSCNEIVAMTGDGVNDGPALKAAHIGIAMGRGSETAKQAAALVVTDDDLGRMVDAIEMGRRIYTNLKKAIQYIISIHIPIILTVFLPLALGWIYPAIFTPVHIIFLELIMGPTCSIIYENEPVEKNAMSLPPRTYSSTFFNWQELSVSIIQGLAITAGTLGIYIFSVNNGLNEAQTRTLVFTTLITSNIFLTLTNRSFYYSILQSLTNKNYLIPVIIGITLLLMALLISIPVMRNFFGFALNTSANFLTAITAGFLATAWFEIWKMYLRFKSSASQKMQ